MQADPLAPGVPPAAPTCLNCGAPLAGAFCAACGQRATTPARVTFGTLWTDFRAGTLGLDRGLFVTVRDVLLRPGAVAAAFAEGRRQVYVHPLAFLFIAYGLYALVFGFFEEAMVQKLTEAFTEQIAGTAGIAPAERARIVSAGVEGALFSVSYGAYISVVGVLPFAYLLSRFLPGSGRTAAECAVLALTVEAGVALVSGLVLNPLVVWSGSFAFSMVSFPLYGILTAVGAMGFFDRRPWTIVRALAAQALALTFTLAVQSFAGAAVGAFVGATTGGH